MNKQVQIYSLDTKAFYTDDEQNIQNKIIDLDHLKYLTYGYRKCMFLKDFYDKAKITYSQKTLNKEYKLYKFLDKYTYTFEQYKAEDQSFIQYKEKIKNEYSRYEDNPDVESKNILKKILTKDELKEYYRLKKLFENVKKILKHNVTLKSESFTQQIKDFKEKNKEYQNLETELKELKKELSKRVNTDEKKCRILNEKILNPYRVVSLFESDLTRILDLQIDELTTKLFIVKLKYNETAEKSISNTVLEQLIKNNFIYNENIYTILAATSGQIREEKVIFIEKSLLDKYSKTMMCGLTIEDINNSEEHGCNINKYLSYLALINSATDVIEDFDIDRAIVIDDFETIVEGTVDFIDNKTFEVTRKMGKVPVKHSDGCGWYLKNKDSKKNKNFMIRLPWVKGLLTPADYLTYCKDFNNENYKITDIYDKEWDLKEDNIQYVFSRSQFKMWKYYKDWDTYKEKFQENKCHANYCNEEPNEFENKRFNYQMLQTLTDMTDKEIDEIIKPTVELLTKAYIDRDTMLMLLGADKSSKKKSYLKQALQIYPELINDEHVKDELYDIINSKRKEAKCGKIKLGCTYTFLIPDVLAWMQYSISRNKNPKGLLENNQVFCKLYKNKKELLVNRSPHLYLEHAVRNNVFNEDKENWFCTDGIYTSCHDLISKTLQFDNDGDKSLVISDCTLIDVAKRNMKDVVPLYYEMDKADPEIINNDNIFKSLKMAFKYGNIGKYSNKLTKLWNDEGNKDLDLIKVICALNNFSIDAAKTLIMPKPPREIKDKINTVNDLDLPYFYQFNKDVRKVSPRNNSTVNRLCKKIEEIEIPVKEGSKNEKYNFSSIGKFKSAMLMNNSKIEIRQDIADKYDEINKLKNSYFRDAKSCGLKKEEVSTGIYNQIKRDLYEPFKDEINIIDFVDIIIKHVYKNHRTCKKSFLFNCFGHVIIENLKQNIKKPLDNGYILCSCCGERIKKESNSQKMCKKCSDEKIKERDRKRKAKK
ncbi:hypothetical protein [Dehalobacter restrictus]|uniref:Uncharacterized protein n=1 Tax=Dehalobacter restrictus TaxID=55583 RepID=A0A857DGQ6_9FIRM|nr:hypothetical protein [Dehalobacter restrictus]QGZ99415.1 hypothetical protein GQ588_01415 [Dehalobacter restrictus]